MVLGFGNEYGQVHKGLLDSIVAEGRVKLGDNSHTIASII